MIYFSLLQFLIAFVGLGLTLFYVINGIVNKERNKIIKGVIYFFSTWLLLLLITVLEFAI
jgi:hypothetical protein